MNKKLYRSSKDVKLAGVCGGLAEYFNIDVTIVRLLWIVGSFMTAFMTGILLYIICACIIPIDDGCIDAEYKEKEVK